MTMLTFIIAIVALIVAIVAYRRSGGAGELKKQIDSSNNLTESLRGKTANTLARMEKALRKGETSEKAAERAEKKE